ncbi:MAG: ATP/GTP-binding protein [Aigarchaeota archaeon]|nr:ATP/GTP-binding protein [Aigarchaeota archaeon]MCX8193394.1 ATP/GTP-binding protein [Nitrososphaeria archaeon]MDW7985924.1 ATP/GTP-binding protein [Nitrososphaerota archaeon]
MYTIFITGTAGSGKSTLASAFSDWLRSQEQSTLLVNLDPAALEIPYEADIDIREMVDYERIMTTRKLGPNAALIATIREVVRHIEELADEVNSHNVDFVIVDTPGQLELFAFRKEGRILTKYIGVGGKVMFFLLDPMFCAVTRNFVASMFLASSIYLTFQLPMIQVLNKIDAVPRKYIDRIERWSESIDSLIVDIENSSKRLLMHLSREIAEAVHSIVSSIPIIPVSSINMEGFQELHGMLTRIISEGEMELR